MKQTKEKRLVSRTARKKDSSQERTSSLNWGVVVKRILLVALLTLAIIFASTAVFLAGMNDEGIPVRTPKVGERLNILVMGIDGGVLEGGAHMIGRSDVLLLVSLDSEAHSAMLLTIPRDTLVSLPNIGENKINAAHVFGGVGLTINAVEKLLSQPVHCFVKLDFAGFRAIVDAVGGVTLDVEKPMQYVDPYADPQLIIDLQPGLQRLDGDKAEQYVRYRDETGDVGRSAQQKKLLLALARQLSNPLNLWRLPLVAQQAGQYLTSNLSFNDLLRCGWTYVTLESEPVLELLPGEGAYDGSYWLADYHGIEELFSAELQSENEEGSGWFNFNLDFGAMFKRESEKEKIRLVVLNGNGGPGSATRASENLKHENYQVVEVGNADSFEYLKSVIVYNNGAEDKAQIVLASLPGALLQPAEEDNPTCDLVVIIGHEYVR